MLTSITIKNYKSIVDLTLELGRFNLFIGENGYQTIKLRQDRNGEVLESIKAAQQAADPFLMMQSAFPAIFPLKARGEFERLLASVKANPTNSLKDLFSAFVERLVWRELNGLRNQNIERELRNP